LQETDTDGALDAIEVAFRVVNRRLRSLDEYDRQRTGITRSPDVAIEDLNARFHEHNLGYQFVDGSIIEESSEYLTQEATEPTVKLLRRHGFRGAEDEFMRAQRHYLKGDYSNAIVVANNAFESTMKAICDARKWRYGDRATASPLIEILFNNELIPRYLQQQFDALRSVMSAGAPAIRNQPSVGHGQGTSPNPPPPHLAAFVLHIVAANIVFLVEAHEAKR